MTDVLPGYAAATDKLATAYDALNPEDLYSIIQDVTPQSGETVLEVGAGTGRDAAYWARNGCIVTAVEPVTTFWRHPFLPAINDTLPDLASVRATKLTFDVITCFGVWHHLPNSQRFQAYLTLNDILKPRGRVLLSFRHGPSPKDRPGYEITLRDEKDTFESIGLKSVLTRSTASIQPSNIASGVTWTWVCLQRG